MNSEIKKAYYRPKEIEQVYGIKSVTVRAWFSKGILTGARIGKLILINGDDLRDKIRRIEEGEDSRNVFFSKSHFGRRAPQKGV
jgi:predicted site-specific integrase-resolvase